LAVEHAPGLTVNCDTGPVAVLHTGPTIQAVQKSGTPVLIMR